MNFVRVLLKFFSCLFTFVLGLVLSGLSLFFLFTRADNVKMGMLPLWTGEPLKYWMLGLGLLGIFSAVLAARNKVRILLVLFSLLALCLIVYGYFLGPYRFSNAAEARNAGWFAFAALVAFLGSLMQFPVRRA